MRKGFLSLLTASATLALALSTAEAAQPKFVPGEVIVKFKASKGITSYALAKGKYALSLTPLATDGTAVIQ